VLEWNYLEHRIDAEVDLENLPRRGWFVGRLDPGQVLGDLFASEVPTHGSQFWRAIQKVKWLFKLGARHLVRNGKRTFFWQDWWTGLGPLHARFPLLFGCCDQPFITVHETRILGGEPGAWRLHFRRQFGLAEAVEWENLCREIQDLPISPDEDQIGWR
jgi:hypothetical protein